MTLAEQLTTSINHRTLSAIGSSVLGELTKIEASDPSARPLKEAVEQLLKAFGDRVGISVVDAPAKRERITVKPPAPPVKPKLIACEEPKERKSTRPLCPGLQTERRAIRKQAGLTLQQVAELAHTTVPTTRMYETRASAVRPQKRKLLDDVYNAIAKDSLKF